MMTIWMSFTVTMAGLDEEEFIIQKMRIGAKVFCFAFSSGVSEKLLGPITTTCIICGYHTGPQKNDIKAVD